MKFMRKVGVNMETEVNVMIDWGFDENMSCKVTSGKIQDEELSEHCQKMFGKNNDLRTQCKNCFNAIVLNIFISREISKISNFELKEEIVRDEEYMDDNALVSEMSLEEYKIAKPVVNKDDTKIVENICDVTSKNLKKRKRSNASNTTSKSPQKKQANKSEDTLSSDTNRLEKKRSKPENAHWYLPKELELPELNDIPSPHYQVISHEDGHKTYISRHGKNGELRVTNFDINATQCDICHQPVHHFGELIHHRKNFHFFPNRTSKCVGCNQTFEKADQKRKHTYYCTDKNFIPAFTCTKCGHISESRDEAEIHLAETHRLKPSCEKASHVQTPISTYEKYRKQKKGEFLCYLCSATFTYKNLLDRHLLRHSDPKPYKCHHCSKGFVSRDAVWVHLVREHFQREAKYICRSCDPPILYTKSNPFKTHWNLMHLGINLSGKKEPCPHCGKILRKDSMKEHIYRAHTGTAEKKRFDCKECEKFFFTKRSLLSHKRVHLPDDQKMFRCKFCKQGFNQKQGMEEHERNHTGEKPYECSVCQKAFARKQAFVDHEKIHFGKGNKCTVCASVFADRGNFRHHMQQHEKQLGIKLTYSSEERRLMRLKVLTAEQALTDASKDTEN